MSEPIPPCDLVSLLASLLPDLDAGMLTTRDSAVLSSLFEPIPLGNCTMSNGQGFNISGSVAWVPKGSREQILPCYKFQVIGHSPDCTFVLVPGLSDTRIVLRGPKQVGVLLSKSRSKIDIRMVSGSTFALGEANAITEARIILNNSDVVVGASGLWSDEIIIQSSEQHGIVDISTNQITNGGRSHITIGRHVWLGRRCMVLKNVSIGDGSIVGAASLVTKDVPPASIAAGVPARVIRSGVSWCENPNKIGDADALEIEALRNR
jgi:acetyltransferase-like isoleucine patch superfamily enzyme